MKINDILNSMVNANNKKDVLIVGTSGCIYACHNAEYLSSKERVWKYKKLVSVKESKIDVVLKFNDEDMVDHI